MTMNTPDPVAPVLPSKPWFQSRTILVNIASSLVTLYLALSPDFHLPAIPAIIVVLLNALGISGRADATTTLK